MISPLSWLAVVCCFAKWCSLWSPWLVHFEKEMWCFLQITSWTFTVKHCQLRKLRKHRELFYCQSLSALRTTKQIQTSMQSVTFKNDNRSNRDSAFQSTAIQCESANRQSTRCWVCCFIDCSRCFCGRGGAGKGCFRVSNVVHCAIANSSLSLRMWGCE